MKLAEDWTKSKHNTVTGYHTEFRHTSLKTKPEYWFTVEEIKHLIKWT